MNALQINALRSAQFLAAFSAFAIVFPVGLGNVTMALLLLAFLVSEKPAALWSLIRTDRVVQAALWLFIALAVGVSYSSSSWQTSLEVLNKYRNLLLLPVLLLLFQQNNWRDHAYYGYLLAVAIAIAASWGMRLGWLPVGTPGQEWTPFKGRIDHGFFVAFACYLMLHEIIRQRPWQQTLGWSAALIIALHNLLFMCEGRTGVMMMVGLILLAAFQHRRIWLRYWIPVVIVGTLILTTIVVNSTAFSGREKEIAQVQTDPEAASTGQRVTYWKNSLVMIADHPAFGTGTGSFHIEYEKHKDAQAKRETDNPHNEYLFIAAQLGMVGLVLLLWFYWQIWHAAKSLSFRASVLAQGTVVAFAIACLFNSSLRDSGNFLVIFAALALSEKINAETGVRPNSTHFN